MVIWEIKGPEIGPEGSGVDYFAKKGDAARALRAWRKENGHGRSEGSGPEKMDLRGRDAVVEFVKRAMKLAMGVPMASQEEDDEDPYGLL